MPQLRRAFGSIRTYEAERSMDVTEWGVVFVGEWDVRELLALMKVYMDQGMDLCDGAIATSLGATMVIGRRNMLQLWRECLYIESEDAAASDEDRPTPPAPRPCAGPVEGGLGNKGWLGRAGSPAEGADNTARGVGQTLPMVRESRKPATKESR